MLNNAEDKLTFKLIKLYPFLVYLEGGEYQVKKAGGDKHIN